MEWCSSEFYKVHFARVSESKGSNCRTKQCYRDILSIYLPILMLSPHKNAVVQILKVMCDILRLLFFVVASRRGSEEIIFAGRVKVNGKVCKVPQVWNVWDFQGFCCDASINCSCGVGKDWSPLAICAMLGCLHCWRNIFADFVSNMWLFI